MTTAKDDIQFQIEFLTQEMVKLLMDECHLTMEQAMDEIYYSRTYRKIEDVNTGLYFQSPVYVLDMLLEETSRKNLPKSSSK